jgi:Superinfection immunity protein
MPQAARYKGTVNSLKLPLILLASVGFVLVLVITIIAVVKVARLPPGRVPEPARVKAPAAPKPAAPKPVAREPDDRTESGLILGLGVCEVCGLLLVISLYFLPSVVAVSIGHHNAAAIVLLNVLAGWTFVGWVVAAVWAVTRPPPVPEGYYPPPPYPPSPRPRSPGRP